MFSAQVQAQDETYVDLSLEVSGTDRLVFTARNLGTAVAYDVSLDIELADQSAGGIFTSATCSGNIPGTTCLRGVWTVEALEPGEEIDISLRTRLASGLPCCTASNVKWTVPARAVVKNTFPEEEELFKGNNVAVGWLWVSRSGVGRERAEGRYWLEASVDDLLAEAGDAVTFNFRVNTTAGTRKYIRDAKVRLKLDNGMGAPTASVLPAGTTFAAAPGLTRTWDWNIGALETFPLDLEVSTTLDDPLPAGVARSDLCLTAELTAHPDNIGVVGQVTYTSAEICLREDPVTVLQGGKTDLFTIYPCVGVATYPCSSSDTLELVVNGGESARAAGIGRDEAIIDPGNVIVQVKDPDGRHSDGDWRTRENDGVTHKLNTNLLTASNWTHLKRSITVPNGVTLPGSFSIRPVANTEFNFLDPVNAPMAGPFALSNTFSVDQVAIFGTLGTYQVTPAFEFTHATIDKDMDGNKDKFTGSGTFTFHVGPIAELEALDGGANPGVQLGRHSFTIVAVNSGPDDAPDAQVVVTGLNARDYVSHSASAGSFDPATGVWTIGELRQPGFYQDIYGRDGEELTIVTSADAGSEITAAISNTQDYQVCIDSSGDDVDASSRSACTGTSGNTWHTAKYFDYISDNNTATIAARAGLAGGAPDTRPGMVGSLPMGGANLVFWSEPQSGGEHQHFGPVRFWDIEYSEDGGSEWAPLRYRHSKFGGSHYYVDRNARGDSTRLYRVRARYDERAGEWTQQGESVARTTVATGDPGVTIRPESLTVREGSRSSYGVRLDARPTGDVVIGVSNTNPDVRLTTELLTFTPSNWNRTQTVYVTAADDRDTADDTDTITHAIDRDATSALEYRDLSVADVTVTVDDRDVGARFTVGRSGVTEIGVDEGSTTTYELALGTRPQQDVRVSLSYPSGIIEVSPRNLTFTPENYNVPQTITVTGVQDEDAVDDDLGFIAHSFSGGYAEDAWLNVTVTDDDRAGVGGEVELALSRNYCPGEWPETLSGAQIAVTGWPEQAGGCFYSLRLNAAPTGNVTITIRADARKVDLDADIYTDAKENRLTFTRENWRDAQEIRFETVWDADGVHNNDFTITHSASGGGYNGVVIPDIAVNVVDADRKYIGIRVEGPPGGIEVVEGDRGTSDDDLYQAVFYVFPETQPMNTVTVSMSSDNSDVTLSPSRLSFTRSNWDQGHSEGHPGKRVVVRANNDADEDDETATITFTVTSSDADYDGLELASVPVRVTDDDEPEPEPEPKQENSPQPDESGPRPAPRQIVPGQQQAPVQETLPVVSIATSTPAGAPDSCGTWGLSGQAPHHATALVALPGDDQVVGCDSVEEGRAAAFDIRLSDTSTQDLRIPVVVEDVEGSNFLHRDVQGCNIIRVPAGAQSVQLVIPTRDDANDEPDGPIWARLGDSFLALFLGVPAREGYELGSEGLEAQVTITDNDEPSGATTNWPPSSNRCRALN